MGLKCVVLARFGDHGRPKHDSPLSSGRMGPEVPAGLPDIWRTATKLNKTSSASFVKELYWDAWGCCVCAQSCLILCDPMDCSPLGSSIYEIFQARVLEWVAISFSRGSS